MKLLGQVMILLLLIGGLTGEARAQAKSTRDNAAAVVGTYDGTAHVEIMQQELKMKLELKRVHRDSVIVMVTNFVLPTGQKFNYRSKAVAVKAEVKNGRTTYRLRTTFMYDYNGMPMKVEAVGTIMDGKLDSTVKATIMESMETHVTYKAKRVK